MLFAIRVILILKLTLIWLINMFHPDYPIQFKPAIAKVDWDQTYDVMQFSLLPESFNFAQAFRMPIFDYIAVERFTPYPYSWANNYSQYLYDLIKTFNYCPHNKLTGISRDIFNFTQFFIETQFNPTNRFFPTSRYFFDFPKGKYIFSWLNLDRPQSDLINEGCQTINQVFRKVTLNDDTAIEFSLFLNAINQEDNQFFLSFGFCANSLVIQKQNNDGTYSNFRPDNIDEFWLYEDIANYFDYFKTELLNHFNKVHDDHGVTNFNGDSYLLDKALPLGHYPKRIEKEIKAIGTVINQDIQVNINSNNNYQYFTEELPKYLRDLCYLKIANNNYWQNQNVTLIDQGFDAKPSTNHQFIRVDYNHSTTFSPNLFRAFSTPTTLFSINKCLSGLVHKQYKGYDYGLYEFDLPIYSDFQDDIYDYLKTLLPNNLDLTNFIENNIDNRNSHTNPSNTNYDIPVRDSGIYTDENIGSFFYPHNPLYPNNNYGNTGNIYFTTLFNTDRRLKIQGGFGAYLGCDFNLSTNNYRYIEGYSFNNYNKWSLSALTSNFGLIEAYVLSDLEYKQVIKDPAFNHLDYQIIKRTGTNFNLELTTFDTNHTLYSEIIPLNQIDFFAWYDTESITDEDYLQILEIVKEANNV